MFFHSLYTLFHAMAMKGVWLVPDVFVDYGDLSYKCIAAGYIVYNQGPFQKRMGYPISPLRYDPLSFIYLSFP